MFVQMFPLDEKNIDFIATDKNITVKAITGNNLHIKKCSGYCSCYLHTGYLTCDLIRKHRCKEKECYYFYLKTASDINFIKN